MACSSSNAEDMIDVLPVPHFPVHIQACGAALYAEVFKEEGDFEYRKGEFSYAIVCYTEGINTNCDKNCDKKNVKAKLFTNRATAHLQLGNYQEALSDAEVGRVLQPRYMKAIETGACACVKLNLFEKAVTWCDEGLAIDPENTTLQELRSISSKTKSSRTDKVESASETGTLEDDKTNQQDVSSEISPLMVGNLLDTASMSDVIPPPVQTLEFDDETLRAIAGVYNNEGGSEYRKGEYVNAIDFYAEGIKVGCQDKNVSAILFTNRATVHFQLGNYHAALSDVEAARKFRPTYPKTLERAAILGSLACMKLNLLGEAITWCDEGLATDQENTELLTLRSGLLKEINTCRPKVEISSEIGTVQEHKTEHGEEIIDERWYKTIKGNVYCSLGFEYRNVTAFEKALEYYELYLCIAKDVGDKGKQGHARHHLGTVYRSLGDFKTAVEYYQQSLIIAKEVGDKSEQMSAYDHLGEVCMCLGDLKAAMEYHQQCLRIAKDDGAIPSQGRIYDHIGSVYFSLGDLKRATEYYQQSLSIAKDVGNKGMQGEAFLGLGIVRSSLGDLKTAVEYYQQSLSIAKDVGEKVLQGGACYHLGIVYRSLGNLKTALEYQKQCLSIAKDVRHRCLQGAAYFELGFSYKVLGDFPRTEDCLKSSVDAYDNLRHLLHSLDDWKISLRNHFRHAYNALWVVQLNRNKIAEALSSAERGRAQGLMDLMKSRYGLELAQSSWSAENTEAISDILRLLPAQTVFLAIGNNSINFWVLDKRRQRIHFRQTKLDGNTFRKEEVIFLQSWIEKVCKTLRSVKYEDRCLDGPAVDELPVQRSEETGSLDGKKGALKELYDKFIGPIADLLHGDEIIIVPDGPLALVPFSAVINQDSRYLSETFRIRLIPSLTSLKLMADCPEGYHSTTGALLVGDPWVGVKVVIDGRCTKLPPLPCAKEEVEMIGKILNTEPLTGERATKAEVLSRINAVALVHIAAHGYFETGEIILALLSEDFLLTMKDILNSKVRARLVVLSCCHTGRGEIKAEGVVGIARAFLGAGARSVVVTLWAIDDKATKEFMKQFYQHLSEGQCVSKSLNRAMKHLRESDNFNDVRCWAPFVLIGDDVTMNFSEISMTASGEEASSFDPTYDV